MNVLSAFDGISCGQIALERAGIPVENYYASEIDQYAIKVTMANYPKTIQLGDVTKWREWNLPKIDLAIAGSPCQGFSFSGLGLNFNDTRSRLFFEFADILDAYKPKWFLLENVRMKKEHAKVISDRLGVDYVEINSSLVSAQSRKRWYWTNIPVVGLPKDKGLLLKDIIEHGEVDRDKSYCIDANYYKGGNLKSYLVDRRRQLVFEHQSHKRAMVKECIQVGEADIKAIDSIRRVYSPEGKSPTLTTMGGGHREPKISEDGETWRKLTPLECERLQTIRGGYTSCVSNTRRYHALGNGMTVDVIAWILSFIPRPEIVSNS